jgi:uncharacterized protein (DUF2249 family)
VYTIHDDYLGVEEKKLAGKPYRLLTMTSKRSYINQDGKTICDALGNTVITCMYPGDAKEKNAVYGEVKKPCYSKEKLEIIHQHFEEDLAGKFRRGAETLYWEDVQEGEELRRLVKGPLDIVDVISFLCATGAQLGGASTKWAVMRNLLRLKDHDTNEWMPIQSFHFDDKVASQMGMPYALAYAAQHEAYIAQLVCNWMGDDGFVKKLAHQQRKACFQGDMAYVKGQVTRKYIEDGEHLVELNVWTENQHGDKVCPSNAIVKLPTRTPR